MKKLTTIIAVTALSAAIAGSATAATGKHPQGGTLTVPIIAPTFVADFNPLNQVQKDTVNGTMYEPLWVINTKQNNINWRLAQSYEYSNDNKSFTIKLKEGLTWSDGSPIDADDLMFTLGMGKEDPRFDGLGHWSKGIMKGLVKVDDLTVRMEMTEPNTTMDWHMSATMLVPEHVFSKVDDLMTFQNPNPIGSGPMTEVTQATPSQIVMCRNPHYYKADQGLPYLDCLKLRQYSDNSQIQPALIKNEIDWGSNFIADVEKTYVEPSPETHGFWYPANDVWNMYLNTRKAPFSDLAFRKAFSMAVDRVAMVDIATYGYAKPVESVVGISEYFASSLNPKITKKYEDLVEFNPKAAEKLLKKAGYKDTNKDGFLENPDGSEINFEIMIPAGWTDVVTVCQMTTEYLADIGIKAKVKLVDWSAYDTGLKKGTYDVAFNWSSTNRIDPIQAYLDYFHPAREGLIWHAGHGMASEELGTLIDEYMMISDEARRKEILDELMIFNAENLPLIPIMSNGTLFQYNTTHVEGFPTEDNPYVHPVFYNEGTKLLIFENLYQRQN